ncbi:MAG: hypothetical protein AAFV88_13945 [Planctomycetota bacterium]
MRYHGGMKKLRFRFSLRTVIVVTLLFAGYFACWPVTEQQGVDDVSRHRHERHQQLHSVKPIAPLIVRGTDLSGRLNKRDKNGVYSLNSVQYHHEYYVWFFGFVIKVYGPVTPPE